MAQKTFSTLVIMPDDSRIEVDYYCKDIKEKDAKLVIQLRDCVCTLNIEKSMCTNNDALEKLVHNKVINTRGHLC